MKRLFISILFAGILFSACSDLTTNSNEPVDLKAGNSLQHAVKTPLLLPVITDNSLQKQALIGVQLIDGAKGGKITSERKFGTKNGILTLNAELAVPAGAFDGKKLIKFWLDTKTASFEFYPSMAFDKPLEFSAEFKNFPTSGIEEGDVDFAFLGDKKTESVDYEELRAHGNNLFIGNARFHHFSRYAWVK